MAIHNKNWSAAHEVLALALSSTKVRVLTAGAGGRDARYRNARLTSYDEAYDALVTLKDIKVVDLVYDDRLISRLCQLTHGVTEKLIKKHRELHLGQPTEETIDYALMELENENQLGFDADSI